MLSKSIIPVYAIGSHIVSSLGAGVEAHWAAAGAGITGIRLHNKPELSSAPFMGSLVGEEMWGNINEVLQSGAILSPFEQLAAFSVKKVIEKIPLIFTNDDTIFILSATKGNIEWLGKVPDSRLSLHHSASVIAKYLRFTGKHVVISNACTSGIAALIYGLRALQTGRYKHAVVCGCDRFSRFVLAGFQSFMAVSDAPCRPFDAARNGITLGEAAATIILSVEATDKPVAQLASGATTNDANHISGPSRTGEELSLAINRTLLSGGVEARQVSMVSAHGTATLYNDEMEAKAFALSGLVNAPVHSFKGYVGHTLGAAGVLECAVAIECFRYQKTIPSLGFEQLGVSMPLNITTTAQPATISNILKTASGFGGCNAAVLWARV